MRIVFPNLRSRWGCLIARHGAAQAEGVLDEDEMPLVMPFQSAANDPQIKNPKRKKTVEGLHRHFA